MPPPRPFGRAQAETFNRRRSAAPTRCPVDRRGNSDVFLCIAERKRVALRGRLRDVGGHKRVKRNTRTRPPPARTSRTLRIDLRIGCLCRGFANKGHEAHRHIVIRAFSRCPWPQARQRGRPCRLNARLIQVGLFPVTAASPQATQQVQRASWACLPCVSSAGIKIGARPRPLRRPPYAQCCTGSGRFENKSTHTATGFQPPKPAVW